MNDNKIITEKIKNNGEIADIYPAEKLCLFLIYVSLNSGVNWIDIDGKRDA